MNTLGRECTFIISGMSLLLGTHNLLSLPTLQRGGVNILIFEGGQLPRATQLIRSKAGIWGQPFTRPVLFTTSLGEMVVVLTIRGSRQWALEMGLNRESRHLQAHPGSVEASFPDHSQVPALLWSQCLYCREERVDSGQCFPAYRVWAYRRVLRSQIIN